MSQFHSEQLMVKFWMCFFLSLLQKVCSFKAVLHLNSVVFMIKVLEASSHFSGFIFNHLPNEISFIFFCLFILQFNNLSTLVGQHLIRSICISIHLCIVLIANAVTASTWINIAVAVAATAAANSSRHLNVSFVITCPPSLDVFLCVYRITFDFVEFFLSSRLYIVRCSFYTCGDFVNSIDMDLTSIFLFCLISLVIGAVLMILVQYYVFVKYFNRPDDDPNAENQRNRSLNERYQLPDVS